MHKFGYILIAIWFFALMVVGLSVSSACNKTKTEGNLFISIGGK